LPHYPDVQMSSTDDYEDETSGPEPWTLRVKEIFWPSPEPPALTDSGQPELIPSDQRRAVMRSIDPKETKLAFGAFVLATIAGIAIPAYIIGTNKVTKQGKDTIAVAPDAKLLGGLILLLCIIGFVSLWKRKKTLVAFDLFLIGFAFTLFIGLVGIVFILLGGWLLLRSWRINKYGTTNSKVIAKEVASRPRGKAARAAAPKSTGKTPSLPGARKPPTPSKRYTPKAPARKKIPKPTQ
jgi:protein-S-isoprenylcysteine O-methyltransferase Ste14